MVSVPALISLSAQRENRIVNSTLSVAYCSRGKIPSICAPGFAAMLERIEGNSVCTGKVMAMICRNGLVGISLVIAGCDQSDTSLVRDLAECETVAKRAGDWERDGWDAGTATGQYLIDCMKSKGYRRRTMIHGEVYNSWNDVRDKKKPLYRSKEVELFVLRGCYGNYFKIAIAECWEK